MHRASSAHNLLAWAVVVLGSKYVIMRTQGDLGLVCMHSKKNMFYVPIWPSTDSSFKRISFNDNKGFKVQVMRSKIGGNAVFGSKTATAGLSIELGTSRTPSTTRFSNCPARRFAQPSCDYGDISAHISNRNRSILQKQAACYSRDLLPTVTFATRRSTSTLPHPSPLFFFPHKAARLSSIRPEI